MTKQTNDEINNIVDKYLENNDVKNMMDIEKNDVNIFWTSYPKIIRYRNGCKVKIRE